MKIYIINFWIIFLSFVLGLVVALLNDVWIIIFSVIWIMIIILYSELVIKKKCGE